MGALPIHHPHPPASPPEHLGAEIIAPKAFQREPTREPGALVEAVAAGHRPAREALFREHAPYVERVLARVLGEGPDVADTMQDVLIQIFEGIGNLRDPSKLKAWIRGVTVLTARKRIRSRRRARWLTFWPHGSEELEAESRDPADTDLAALRATYRVLDRLPTDLRIVFALRFVEQMELTEIAEAIGLSLATIKRHLRKAQDRFNALARREPTLAEWITPASRGSADE